MSAKQDKQNPNKIYYKSIISHLSLPLPNTKESIKACPVLLRLIIGLLALTLTHHFLSLTVVTRLLHVDTNKSEGKIIISRSQKFFSQLAIYHYVRYNK